MECVKVTQSSPSLDSSTLSSANAIVYTPRLKKVLKSYQLSATKSLNGPDWVHSRTSPNILSPPIQTQTIHDDSKPSSASSSMVISNKQQVLSSNDISHKIGSKSNNNLKKDEIFDPFLAPPPFPIQQPPIFTPPDQNRCERSETILESETISCFAVGGEKRLCLPQILTTVLREFSLPQINSVCDDLQIFCSRCTTDQLEVLKVNGIIPVSAPSCGLITKTDAERLCAALLYNNPPKSTFGVNTSESSSSGSSGNGKTLFSFSVYHECFGKCMGLYIPSLYVQPFSGCIECLECHGLFAPQKFVCHSHRSKENRTCHWGFDSSNWRAYLLLAKDVIHKDSDGHSSELETHLKEMKCRFDFKRKHNISSNDSLRHLDSLKRLKVEETSSTPTSSSLTSSSSSTGVYSYPSYLYSPYSWASDPSMLMYWYPALAAASGNNPNSLAARLSAFKPWSGGGSIGNGKLLQSASSHTLPHGYSNNMSTQKLTDPPVQNAEKVSSNRLSVERHFQPNVSLTPLDATEKSSLRQSDALKVNVNETKTKSLSKDKINYLDEDSLSSTTTFSSEYASLSDEESTNAKGKSEKLFHNLHTILDDNNVNHELRKKIMNEVQNIVTRLIRTSSAFSSLSSSSASRAHKSQVSIAPKKKLLNGLTAENCIEKEEKYVPLPLRRSSEELFKSERSGKKMMSNSPLTLMPMMCSPSVVKCEPSSSPSSPPSADPKINCVH